MNIKGQIVEPPIPLDGCSAYVVNEQGKKYIVFTSGMQSAKDCVFIDKGQNVEITGNCITGIEGVILPDKATIDLT